MVYIDFPEKLRSTRADNKLVDAPAIDGELEEANLPSDFAGRVISNKGLAPVVSTAYAVNDLVRLASGTFRLCLTAGNYTATAIEGDDVNWQTFGTGSSTTDQTARDAASAAQVEIDTHEASTHNQDAQARASAATAQAEIDAHETSIHNQDTTARENATSAQNAADNVQTEVLAHVALPHNTDQIARDGVDVAQQAANAAGAVAMDANAAAVTAQQTAAEAETDAAAADQRILDHIASHPGSTTIFSPNSNGTFPAVTQDMYDDGAVLIAPRSLRVPFRYPDGGTTRNMASWFTYAPANFYTVLQYSNFPTDAPDGSRGYTTYNHGFWIKESGHWLTAAPPPGTTYLGEFLSNGAANDAVSGNNQLAYFSRILHVSSSYVIGGDATYRYGWTADAPVPHRLIETEATDPDSETFGEVSGEILHALVDVEFDGHGHPGFDPDYVGQFAVNQAGDTWSAGFELVDHSTDPSWTAANLADVSWNRFEGVSTSGGDPQTIGGFYYRTHIARFHVLDQQFNTENLTWSALIDLYRAHNELIGNPPTGLVPLAGEKSIFLSSSHIAFSDDDEAAAHVAAEQIANPTTKVFLWFVGESGDESNWTFRWATAGGWVAGVTDITEALFWNGPFDIDDGGTDSVAVEGLNRSVLRAKNDVATRINRTVRHLILTTNLTLIDDDDDIEILLETGGVSSGSVDLGFVYPPIRIQASLIKTRTASTLSANLALTASNSNFVQADKSKYLPVKIDRGNGNDGRDFGHDTLFIGRVNNTTLCVWTAADIGDANGAWAFVTVNRVQYGTGQVQTSTQQAGDGSVGGYYFGAFYQQAAVEPAFNGVPDNDGAWLSLGNWQADRGLAVDPVSTDPIWIAYASGYINDSDVIFVSSPQVFAEFSTQYSNDGFATITSTEPTDLEGWWRRDRLPGGEVTAPIPLFHTDNPWIPVWAEEYFYTINDNGASKDIDLNLSNVTAIRFTLTAFGRWSDDDIPERQGAICTDVMPRPPEGWSTTDFNDNGRATTGIYSVYYHESAGLQVHHQDDGSAADFNIPIGSYRATNYPARSWACAMKFIAPDTNDFLQLTALRIFDSSQHYERFLWTIEVQREN